jgi:hypothetical protein
VGSEAADGDRDVARQDRRRAPPQLMQVAAACVVVGGALERVVVMDRRGRARERGLAVGLADDIAGVQRAVGGEEAQAEEAAGRAEDAG